VTSLADSGPGSLRQAIYDAAFQNGGSAKIDFSVTGTITLDSPLVINGANNALGAFATISGPGASSLFISGNNAVQVFVINQPLYDSVQQPLAVAISGVTIENGTGGGLSNINGTVTLTNSTITGNSGGGIYNYGVLTIASSTISGNSGGNGISNEGTLTLTNSTVSGNSNEGISSGGIFYVSDSTISGNSNEGIQNYNWGSVTNSTISGNGVGVSTSYGDGALGGYSGGTTTLTNSTVSGNGTGIWMSIAATMQLQNTILANSANGNCVLSEWDPEFGLPNPIVYSGRYNLSDDSSCWFFWGTDMNNTPAYLDPNGLEYGGGPTATIMLLNGSPAINAVPMSNCTSWDGSTPITTDQRGIPRPQGAACDIGAYEYQVPSMAISLEHTASFVQGDLADNYIINVANPSGPGSTVGTLTITDTLPSGITATAMFGVPGTPGGTDWSCTTSTATCTRTTPMPPGETDTITLTVSVGYGTPVGPNAVMNYVLVSGAGISAPQTANDPTTVRATQTITFNSIPAQVQGITGTLVAAASSGLPVSFASLTTKVCTVSGATATLIIPGTCTIRASQRGNATYVAAPPVSQSFKVESAIFTLDNFTSGPYVKSLNSASNVQDIHFAPLPSGSPLGAARGTAFLLGGDPYAQPSTLSIGKGICLVDTGFGDANQLQVEYGYTLAGLQAPLGLNLAGYAGFQLNFAGGLSSSQSLIVVITVWPQSGGYYNLEMVLPPNGNAFSVDFPFSGFSGGGLTQSQVSNIQTILIQAQGGGFASFGITSFQAVN